jgi:hypothetical protein
VVEKKGRERGSARTTSYTVVGHRNDQAVFVAREEEALVPAFIHSFIRKMKRRDRGEDLTSPSRSPRNRSYKGDTYEAPHGPKSSETGRMSHEPGTGG